MPIDIKHGFERSADQLSGNDCREEPVAGRRPIEDVDRRFSRRLGNLGRESSIMLLKPSMGNRKLEMLARNDLTAGSPHKKTPTLRTPGKPATHGGAIHMAGS
jgi:hypothetical protein